MIVTDFRLSPRDRAVLAALAPITCSPEITEQNLVEATVDGVEDFLRSVPPLIPRALGIGIALFEWSASLHPAHGGKVFSQLSPEQASQWFDLWWHSPVSLMREFARRSKGLLAAVYYEHEEIRAGLEYHPDRWISKVAKRRLDRFSEEIRQKEARVTSPDPLLQALSQGGTALPKWKATKTTGRAK